MAFSMTQFSATLQKSAIFLLTSAEMGASVRQTRMSGWMPADRSSFTECWVGLLLSSPEPGTWTMRGTWMEIALSLPSSAMT